MNEYKEKELQEDTRRFLKSQYGNHVMTTLEEISLGHLSNAADISTEHPDRHLAKYSAIKEIIDFIQQPLDDDQRVGG